MYPLRTLYSNKTSSLPRTTHSIIFCAYRSHHLSSEYWLSLWLPSEFFSNLSIFLAVWADHTTVQYSSWDLANAQDNVLRVVMSFIPLHVLLTRLRILLALLLILSTWAFQDNLLLVIRPGSENSKAFSRVWLFICRPEWKSVFFFMIRISLHLLFSIYTVSDLGVLSNLIGSLSLTNEHYSPPTEWIMRKPNKNEMAGVNSLFASVSEVN